MDSFLLGCMDIYKEVRKPIIQFTKDLFDSTDIEKRGGLLEGEFL